MAPPDICEWAELNVRLPRDLTSRPGRLRLDSYQRSVLRAMADPELHGVTLMGPSQSFGKTLMFSILMGWIISESPRPVFFMHATEGGLKKFVREKIDPMLLANKRMNDKVGRGLRGVISLDGFSYPGGYCTMTTARSVSGRHGTTAETVIADEIDDYGLNEDVTTLRQRMASATNPKIGRAHV